MNASNTRVRHILCGFTLLALVATACGGDSSAPEESAAPASEPDAPAEPDSSEPADSSESSEPSEEDSSDAAGTASDVGVTEDSITLGIPTFRTGPVATDGIHFAMGWESCFNRINDEGGINGRKIEIISDDTAFDATQALPIATKLVEQDNVFAVVASQDLTFHLSTEQYLHDNGVPDIGTSGLPPVNPELTSNFAIGASTVTIGHIMGDYAYESGMRNVAILGHEVGELGTSVLDAAAEAFEARGGEVAFQQEFPLTTTDQPALLARATSEGTDGILLNASSQMYLQFMAAANNAGAQPENGWVLGPGAEDVIEDLAEQAPRVYGVTGGFDSIFTDDPTEEMQLLTDAYAEYFPEERPWTFSYHGWVGCRLFEQAARELGDDLTRETIVESLNELEDYDTGLGPSYTWAGNESRVVNRGAAVVGAIDGEISQVREWGQDPLAEEES